MRIIQVILFCFILHVELASAQSPVTDNAGAGRSYKNLIYKVTDAGDSLALDIFLPPIKKAAGKIPVLVIIHGGGWVAGERTLETIVYMKKLKEGLTAKDFAVISIDYTLLSNSRHLPLPVIDCKDAIRWIRTNAAKYNLDEDNIGLWGGSAGGHLALLVGYTNDKGREGEYNRSPVSARVNYVIDNFGPTDLNKLLRTDAGWFTVLLAKIFMPKMLLIREQLVYALTGYAIPENKEDVKRIAKLHSPLEYINTGAIPTLIFHGTKDNVVPLEQSKKLYALLNAQHNGSELVIVKNGDHGFNNISETETDSLVARTVSFALKHSR